MMNHRRFWFFLCLQLSLVPFVVAQQSFREDTFSPVQSVFDAKCITCHGGEEPAAGMSLERGQSYRNLVNASSAQVSAMKRIAPNDPSSSYLYRKVLRDKTQWPYQGEGMPLDDEKLSPEEIEIIKNWISSFSPEVWGEPAAVRQEMTESADSPFMATQLINLPTTRVLGTRTAEFRILHRFATINGGGYHTLGSFFGLDNGAITSINLSVALDRHTDLLVRRTGENKDIELAVKYVPIEPSSKWPVSLGLYAGFDWISRKDVMARNRFSPNIQLLAGYQWKDRWSFMIVPGVAFRSNHSAQIIKLVNDTTLNAYQDTRATWTVGLGLQYVPFKNTAISGEYIPRIGGYRGNKFASDTRYDTWSLGLSYKIRLHVFQVILSNSQSIHTNQYLPGSPNKSVPLDKWLNKGPALHLGFNIYRQFKW